VRSDFLEGKNGAICITKEDMAILEELTQLIFPKRTAGEDMVSGAAQFLVNLLDRKKKDWTSSKTFADIFDLIMSVNSCDYFKNIKNSQKANPMVQVNNIY